MMNRKLFTLAAAMQLPLSLWLHGCKDDDDADKDTDKDKDKTGPTPSGDESGETPEDPKPAIAGQKAFQQYMDGDRKQTLDSMINHKHVKFEKEIETMFLAELDTVTATMIPAFTFNDEPMRGPGFSFDELRKEFVIDREETNVYMEYQMLQPGAIPNKMLQVGMKTQQYPTVFKGRNTINAAFSAAHAVMVDWVSAPSDGSNQSMVKHLIIAELYTAQSKNWLFPRASAYNFAAVFVPFIDDNMELFFKACYKAFYHVVFINHAVNMEIDPEQEKIWAKIEGEKEAYNVWAYYYESESKGHVKNYLGADQIRTQRTTKNSLDDLRVILQEFQSLLRERMRVHLHRSGHQQFPKEEFRGWKKLGELQNEYRTDGVVINTNFNFDGYRAAFGNKPFHSQPEPIQKQMIEALVKMENGGVDRVAFGPDKIADPNGKTVSVWLFEEMKKQQSWHMDGMIWSKDGFEQIIENSVFKHANQNPKHFQKWMEYTLFLDGPDSELVHKFQLAIETANFMYEGMEDVYKQVKDATVPRTAPITLDFTGAGDETRDIPIVTSNKECGDDFIEIKMWNGDSLSNNMNGSIDHVQQYPRPEEVQTADIDVSQPGDTTVPNMQRLPHPKFYRNNNRMCLNRILAERLIADEDIVPADRNWAKFTRNAQGFKGQTKRYIAPLKQERDSLESYTITDVRVLAPKVADSIFLEVMMVGFFQAFRTAHSADYNPAMPSHLALGNNALVCGNYYEQPNEVNAYHHNPYSRAVRWNKKYVPLNLIFVSLKGQEFDFESVAKEVLDSNQVVEEKIVVEEEVWKLQRKGSSKVSGIRHANGQKHITVA